MAGTLKISGIDQVDQVRREATAFGVALTGDEIGMIVGQAAQQLIKEHFEKLANDSAHHKTARSLGAQRTGLYEEASRATQQPVLERGGVSVSINQVAIAQRYFGGTIVPVNAKFLAIPARTETYGHRPREFKDLHPIFFKSGAAALADAEGGVYFWLVKSVTQSADPTVLPEDSDLLDHAMLAAAAYVGTLWQMKRAA
jgi:hypothetical protein